MPDECPRAAESIKVKKGQNRNEVVKLIMWWLMGHHNNECSNESKARQAPLIDNTLSAELQAGGTSDKREATHHSPMDKSGEKPPAMHATRPHIP